MWVEMPLLSKIVSTREKGTFSCKPTNPLVKVTISAKNRQKTRVLTLFQTLKTGYSCQDLVAGRRDLYTG